MPDLVPAGQPSLYDVVRALKGDRTQPPGDYSIGKQWYMYGPQDEMDKDPLTPPVAPTPTPGFPPASDWMHDKVGQSLFGTPPQYLQQMASTKPVDQNLPKLPQSGFVPSLSPMYMNDTHPLSRSPGPNQPPIFWQPG